MPMLDMPIEKLKLYRGSSIIPEHFNEFWTNKLKQVNELKLEYSLVRREFINKNACYYDIEFKSIDGSIIYAKYITPNKKGKFPVVLEFHDYKQSSKSWHHLTRYIALDYAVLAMDCRGQGGKTEDILNAKGPTVCGHIIKGINDEVEKMYYVQIYIDALILSRIAGELENTDKDRLIAFGRGQGATIALVVSALNSNIRKCSLQNPFLCDFKRVWEMDLDIDSYEGIRYYFKWFDPMHIKETDFFKKLGYIDAVNFAPLLKCELLVGTGLLDKVSPPSTQFAIYNNVTCNKKHIIFPKHGHEIINEFENENLKFMKF